MCIRDRVLVTHDIEFSARYAHRCAFLFDGGIVSQEAPDLFFTTNQFYTTAACKMSRGILDGAVTCLLYTSRCV